MLPPTLYPTLSNIMWHYLTLRVTLQWASVRRETLTAQSVSLSEPMPRVNMCSGNRLRLRPCTIFTSIWWCFRSVQKKSLSLRGPKKPWTGTTGVCNQFKTRVVPVQKKYKLGSKTIRFEFLPALRPCGWTQPAMGRVASIPRRWLCGTHRPGRPEPNLAQGKIGFWAPRPLGPDSDRRRQGIRKALCR